MFHFFNNFFSIQFIIGSAERRKIIDVLRKEGNFLYNTQHLPAEADKITCRRPQVRKPRLNCHFRVCPSCKGYYSKMTLRRHYRKCADTPKSIKDIMFHSKRVEGNISKDAGETLRDEVFPVFRDSPAVDVIRHDTLAIARGNMLCSKYRLKHMQKMIRSQLKMLGGFLLELKGIENSIKELQDAFHPKYFHKVVMAINKMGKLDDKRGIYSSPGTARALCTTLKQCARNLMSQCIIDGDFDKKQNVKNFYHLMVDEFPSFISATVSETVQQRKRKKKVTVPSTDDVKTLSTYCARQRANALNSINKDGFHYIRWKTLAECTLIAIQVFNRRRAGELERCSIEDYRNRTNLTDHELPAHRAAQPASEYVRFEIRGKRARGVAVLLNEADVQSMETVLKYRELAGVSPQNPYVFGIPGVTNYNHLQACHLMLKFSRECGAKNPELLRGTLLRKHLATESAAYNLADNEIGDLAMHLGHEKKIHQDHYRQPVRTREIIGMSQLLQRAQGK